MDHAANQIELIARGLLIRDNAVLLCRNTGQNYLYLPGGHVEFGESAEQALVREFHEETGWQCRVGELLLAAELRFTQDRRARHEVSLVFHVEHLAPPAPPASEAEFPTGSPAEDPEPGHPPLRVDPHPAIESRETGIAFVWMDLAAVPEADLRPDVIRAWLVAGGRSDTPRADWISRSE